MVEIRDREELETWLLGRSPEVAVIIAVRAALRVIPIINEYFSRARQAVLFRSVLACTREALYGAAAGTWPKSELLSGLKAKDIDTTGLNTIGHEIFYAASGAAGAGVYSIGIAYTAYTDAGKAIDDDVGKVIDAAVSAVASAADAFDPDVIWGSIDFDVNALENGETPGSVRSSQLWAGSLPQEISKQWDELRDTLAQVPAFDFWIRWYESVLVGFPQNWGKLRKIVSINDDIWRAGPDAVAEEIAKIEARYVPKPIPKTILGKQVTVLIQNATTAQTSGNVLALQIEDAITSYLREEECNGIPEDLSVLEHLPAALRRLTSAVSAAQNDENRVAELALAIQAMESEIQALRDQLETLQSAPPESPFLKSFKEQSGKSLGDWKMWGALISGSYLLLGEPAAGTTLAHIAETLKSLIGKPPT